MKSLTQIDRELKKFYQDARDHRAGHYPNYYEQTLAIERNKRVEYLQSITTQIQVYGNYD